MIKISTLPKTWIFDLDGTIVKHNGYLIDGKDTLLEGARDFFRSIPKEDYVLILSSRKKKYRRKTIKFLRQNKIRFDEIRFDMPVGERILVNDEKPKGLKTSLAINTKRDEFMKEKFEITEEI